MEEPKVLYVDDEILNTFLFEKSFQKDLNILTANSGREGLDLLKSQQDVKIVLSDMRMPEMDGIQFIEQAKSIYPDKKYAIVSGYELTHEISTALKEGTIHQFLKKPYDPDDLMQMINTLSES